MRHATIVGAFHQSCAQQARGTETETQCGSAWLMTMAAAGTLMTAQIKAALPRSMVPSNV